MGRRVHRFVRGVRSVRAVVIGLCVLGGGIVTGCVPSGETAGPGDADPRPNLLLVSLDTLRGDHLGVHGYARDTSPFYDRLAERSLLFEDAWTQTHGTPPAHATLFTSLYQETHRVAWEKKTIGRASNRLPPGLPSLPEVLRDAGYRTVAVTDSGFLSRDFAFDRGFDHYDDVYDGARVGGRKIVRLLRSALRGDAPVFAFWHTYEVHTPYEPPRAYLDLFGRYESRLRPIAPDLNALRQLDGRPVDHMSKGDLDFLVARYDAEIRHTDDELRLLWDRLERIGFFDRSHLIILTSDHGEEFGERGDLLHGTNLYQELVHVPLLLFGSVVDDAGAAGQRGGPAGLVDIAPTLYAAAGVAPPEVTEGEDLLARAGQGWSGDRLLFSQLRDQLFAVRDQRFKAIVDQRGRLELYDLRADPGETKNVAQQFPGRARTLRAALERWRAARPELADVTSLESTAPIEDALSDARRRQLEALGYLDAESDTEPDAEPEQGAPADDPD